MLNDVSKRNKLLRLADRSRLGWATVAEHMSDDLASDSEDEKRMKATENRALLQMKSSRKLLKNLSLSFMHLLVLLKSISD